MKKISALVVCIIISSSLFGQGLKDRRVWINFQAVEQFGLNKWSSNSFVNDHMPASRSTDFRASLNIRFDDSFGMFLEMGGAILSASKAGGINSGLYEFPGMEGKKFYVKNATEAGLNDESSGSFKMACGFFDKYSAGKWRVMPYVGIGMMTMNAPHYNLLLKEEGSNMMYNMSCTWFDSQDSYYSSYDGYDGYNDYYYDNTVALGFLTARLNFVYPLAAHRRLLLGVEYNYFFPGVDFNANFTNYYNANIQNKINIKGNHMHMLGISLGISFM